jgi:hypothetical protein
MLTGRVVPSVLEPRQTLREHISNVLAVLNECQRKPARRPAIEGQLPRLTSSRDGAWRRRPERQRGDWSQTHSLLQIARVTKNSTHPGRRRRGYGKGEEREAGEGKKKGGGRRKERDGWRARRGQSSPRPLVDHAEGRARHRPHPSSKRGFTCLAGLSPPTSDNKTQKVSHVA